MAQAQVLVSVLKSALKGKGITYEAVAERLDLSEVSVKRLFTGRVPMSLERLGEICAVVGLDFYELAKMARGKEDEGGAMQLTLLQEEALAKDEKLFICFYSLVKGLPLAVISSQFRISQQHLQRYLLQLDSLKLVELHAANKVRLLVSRSIKWAAKGPLSKKYEAEMRADFVTSEFESETEILRFVTAPLSLKSRVIINRKIRLLANELMELSQVDCALDKKLDRTATLLIGFREWTPSVFRHYFA